MAPRCISIKKATLSSLIFFLVIFLGIAAMVVRELHPNNGNRLADSDSPYLLKHADNPVNWYEWGEEALNKAKKEDKLIFLSIGYTACHWCNELERECFEHQDFADVINPRYVSIKVDREQRPDLDDIYMQAAVAFRGSGGWPNNVFLTPDLHPIYSVGYQKREVFKNILIEIDKQWQTNRENLVKNGQMTSQRIKEQLERGGKFDKVAQLELNRITRSMDKIEGGFGSSTKFPMTSILEFIMMEGFDDTFLTTTLDSMANRGLFDHVGGGFHRYSTDPLWAVPHFEKMLYDNALLARLYARAALILEKPEYGEVALETLKFIERELMNKEGGFLSSLDADSEDGEGFYYTWSLDELLTLGVDPEFVNDYGVTAEGNVSDVVATEAGARQEATGKSTLIRRSDQKHKKVLEKLFGERSKRARPPLDDKVVASWHAMTVSAFAVAGVTLDKPKLIAIAERGAQFTLDKLKFNHNWRGGKATGAVTLNDLAFAAMAFWDLFEATGKEKYLTAAIKYVDHAKKDFAAGDGGYYLVEDAPDLIARPRVTDDNPMPSGAAVLARVDWRLSAVLNEPERAEDARNTAAHLLGVLGGASLYAGESMILHRETTAERIEVVYAWGKKESQKMEWLRKGIDRRWGIVRVPLGASSISSALTEGRLPTKISKAYVCRDTVCLAPSETPDDITIQLEKISSVKKGS